MVNGWSRFDECGLGEILYAPSTYSEDRNRQEQYVYGLLGPTIHPVLKSGTKKTGLRFLAMPVAVALFIAAVWLLLARAPAGGADLSGESVPQEESLASDRREGCTSILVVGRDASGVNTDTILLAFFDRQAHVLNVVSIPRDTLVNVSWSTKKINSVAGRVGVDGLLDTIEGLFGYRPDDWVIVDMNVFEDVINELGGVYFDVPVDMDYDDPSQELSIHYRAGEQLLSGYDALCVFRFRQNNDGTGYLRGDLERIEVQHTLLSAVTDELFSAKSLTNLGGIVSIVTEKTDTSLTMKDILWYGVQLLGAGRQSVRFYTMPVQDVSAGSLSYVYPDVDAWVQMLNDSFNPYVGHIDAGSLQILYPGQDGTICMTNGSEPYTNYY